MKINDLIAIGNNVKFESGETGKILEVYPDSIIVELKRGNVWVDLHSLVSSNKQLICLTIMSELTSA
jgi:uncharacterized protein YkvS